jgi:hypothetical protein
MQKFDHNIGFWEKRQFFRRKLSKIAENWNYNIDLRPYDRKLHATPSYNKFAQYVYIIYKILQHTLA